MNILFTKDVLSVKLCPEETFHNNEQTKKWSVEKGKINIRVIADFVTPN